MFALRGAIVSLAVFAIVYCALSVAVLFIWRRVYVWTRRLAPRHVENSLFALRMLPFAGAVLVTLAFTVPSFILLEPRSIHEPIDAELLALAACGVALQVYGLANAVSALRKASRAIAAWMLAATPLEVESSIPVLRVSEPAPAMLAGGIVNPRVLVSGAAEFVLTGNEMQAALNHEVAHVRRRDNLKKLVFRCVSFPGMRHLETAWFEAAEMAADDAAVCLERRCTGSGTRCFSGMDGCGDDCNDCRARNFLRPPAGACTRGHRMARALNSLRFHSKIRNSRARPVVPRTEFPRLFPGRRNLPAHPPEITTAFAD
jgi:hypothetical protein